MIPSHRYFDSDVTKFPGDEQNFHIKAEPFERLTREYLPGDIGAENFEAALGIRDGQARSRRASMKLKTLPASFAKAGLMDPDQRTVERSANRWQYPRSLPNPAHHSFCSSRWARKDRRR